MSAVWHVAADLLREASSRKWFLALGAGITLLLITLGFSLEMTVVDGVLAGTRLFGESTHDPLRSVEVGVRPIFITAAYVIFYGGAVFLVLACSDFAPSLLSPGRIEHLLALPVRRWSLLVGTYLGVLCLAALCALYGAAGLSVVLGFKTQVWTAKPMLAALLGVLGFAPIYAVMLAVAVFARSASFSAAIGAATFVAGIIAGYRHKIAVAFEPGVARAAFKLATAGVPRLSTLADTVGAYAGAKPLDLAALGALLAGIGAFSLSALALAIWRFEQKDY